jgi:hexulose-6-phosphate isomerase
MTHEITRREVLKGAVGAAGAMAALGAAPTVVAKAGTPQAETTAFKKGVIFGMLPGDMPVPDRFKMLKDAGFDGVEAYPEPDLKKAEQLRTWAEQAGIDIHSVMYGGWDAPLSHPDPAVAQRGEDGLRTCLKSAQVMGARDVLLVPAIVNAETRYVDAYTRSQRRIRRVIPLAEELKVMILVEEVWNNFLLSPLEYARYIDEFKTQWVQSYFDVGNVVAFAWPEDWILTVGKRIHRVHLKDFKRGPREFVNLGDGDVDWKKVRDAFRTVGYNGWFSAELDGGNAAYFKDLAGRIDRLIGGKV